MRNVGTALACLAVLAWAAPAPAQKRPSEEHAPAFERLDTSRDGRVSLEEVLAYARLKSAEAQPFRIAGADADGDGRLSPEERRRAGIVGLESFGHIDLRELDKNGDGYVSREELDEFFRKRHGEAFARADADGDGRLSPSEFVLLRF